MKVYTKKGDTGETGLIGGTRVPKNHVRIEAYGTVDELNSYLGLLRDQKGAEELQDKLIMIQEELFTIGSHLANDPEKSKFKLPDIDVELNGRLEQWIDEMDATLPAMTNFVLPGGHPSVSHCHIARCVCRRAERATIALHHTSEIQVGIIAFLNRLSDYLFVLARKLGSDLEVVETPWKPRG